MNIYKMNGEEKMSKRTEVDIIRDILEYIMLCSPQGAKFTQMMERCNMTHGQLKKVYLPKLINNGLITRLKEKHKSRGVYFIKKRGIEYYINLRVIQNFVKFPEDIILEDFNKGIISFEEAEQKLKTLIQRLK